MKMKRRGFLGTLLAPFLPKIPVEIMQAKHFVSAQTMANYEGPFSDIVKPILDDFYKISLLADPERRAVWTVCQKEDFLRRGWWITLTARTA